MLRRRYQVSFPGGSASIADRRKFWANLNDRLAKLGNRPGPDADKIKHKLDLFLPKDQKDFPVVIFVHGGAWRHGDKNFFGVYSALGKMFARNGIGAVFHYVPLHSSPAGMRFGRPHGELSLTTKLSQQLIRLPMWFGLSEAQQQRVVDVLGAALRK